MPYLHPTRNEREFVSVVWTAKLQSKWFTSGFFYIYLNYADINQLQTQRRKHLSFTSRQPLVSCTLHFRNSFFLLWRCDPTQVMASSFTRFFLDHTYRRTTVGRTPLDEWSARRRDLYLTTHNKHNRQTSMPPLGFEPTISVGERPQTYALDRAATGTGM